MGYYLVCFSLNGVESCSYNYVLMAIRSITRYVHLSPANDAQFLGVVVFRVIFQMNGQ